MAYQGEGEDDDHTGQAFIHTPYSAQGLRNKRSYFQRDTPNNLSAMATSSRQQTRETDDLDDAYDAEQDEQDEQEMQMQTNILLEKRARKLAEEDAQRLYARVKNLEREEDKATKRITETKKKAREIVKLRERNELVRQEKDLRQQQLDALVEQQKEENLARRDEQSKNRMEREDAIFQEKVAVVQQTKEERAEIEKLLLESRLLSRKEALVHKETIRASQDEARRKLEQLKIARLQMVRGPSVCVCKFRPWSIGLPMQAARMHALW